MADCLTQDEVEQIMMSELGAKDLASSAQVCRLWREAFRRVSRIPQWVGALSCEEDLERAAVEACTSAMQRLRCAPDLCYIFVAPYHEEGAGAGWSEHLQATVRRQLGTTVEICGCSGSAIVGTDGGSGAAPVLIEGSSALSISLVYFAGQSTASVRLIPDSEPVPAPAPCDEKQMIFLTVPRSAGRANEAINALCAGAGKAVVFGGIASGPRTSHMNGTALFHSGGSASTGSLVCTLTPEGPTAAQLDAVVVSASARVGPIFEVTECETHSQEGHDFNILTALRDTEAPEKSLIPIAAVTAHGAQISGVMASNSLTAEGDLAPPLRSLNNLNAHNGALVTTTPCGVGTFLQPEVMEPKVAAQNAQRALKALASEPEKKAEPSSGAGGGEAGAAAAAEAEDEERHQLARSSSRLESKAQFLAGGGLLFSCLGRSGSWYEQNEMSANFEADAYAAAFPGKALAGFLANGEIFGEFRAPAKPEAAAGDGAGGEDDLSGMSVKEIKRELSEASVAHADCVEKSDLVARLRELRDAKAVAAARAAEESEQEEQDFMHGFTAVFGVSVAAQGAEDWGEVAG